jgi:hypothetical protein
MWNVDDPLDHWVATLFPTGRELVRLVALRSVALSQPVAVQRLAVAVLVLVQPP